MGKISSCPREAGVDGVYFYFSMNCLEEEKSWFPWPALNGAGERRAGERGQEGERPCCLRPKVFQHCSAHLGNKGYGIKTYIQIIYIISHHSSILLIIFMFVFIRDINDSLRNCLK